MACAFENCLLLSCVHPTADGTCAGVRCHPEATCEQNPRPVCVCKPGYEGDGRKCSGKVLYFKSNVVV